MINAALRFPRLFADGAGELNVTLTLATGSLTALVGPSGSGKTTLLRLLAGLDVPSEGRIVVDGQVWLDTQRGINQRPQQRSVGYIFQDAALFPNLTVRENILFVTPRGERTRADDLIEATGLTPFVDQKPAKLSGGQQKRVALARALVRRPQLLLLDEPFAALDTPAADQLRQVVLDLHRAWGTTTLLVSHHRVDVAALAERVISLHQGQIQADQPTYPADKPAGRISRIWFDEAAQVWVVDTDTFQVRSADARWGQRRVGDRIEVSWLN
ncbi:molybdate transport system ATP-binding protein [Fibrella aestuarina BUZ 2]|uniref:Molybdate transport system ATP-binding protein n=1 Tax=Fibrella aestuarina BUZ 2 TaxID=1166018 RepID=I0KF17_9BACT|nr:ATP-binding cassette domain-containing protein [Fibrella aestuarina]CCH02720.1 molybdate transport system ATP-binding protein [Fibrella aestuarina BUZ 2]